MRALPNIVTATIVSRGGNHIAGAVPRGAHLDTFVAMSAILVGAAESATGELKEKLRYIVVELTERKLVLLNAGPRVFLILTAAAEAPVEELVEKATPLAQQISENV